ncbi:hypothetical protein J056_003623 [Wallemia ichthyophaga EXF-994]|uniref:Pet127-domain-containing protein n=1 Tax=Wallemia ichthyophaga (strain EXF-994 / CBS 113033) TaxID=1299270 RepID=R9AIA3_WALI9|nr:uncharacterized protein J056_003623 [Wallemia ichthyophaga EXF-994]EOR01947.1 hypothetical protein J056_003623 [Wallemia ichthyophaga EXF-994]
MNKVVNSRARRLIARRRDYTAAVSLKLSDKLRSLQEDGSSSEASGSGSCSGNGGDIQIKPSIVPHLHYIDDNLPSGFSHTSRAAPQRRKKEGVFRPQENEKRFDFNPLKSNHISGVKVDQPRIPTLVSALQRVLFQPSHPVWLRCPRTGVYSFPSHLEDINPPEEFAFDRLPPYMTSSKDKDLIDLTKKQNCRYLGSTSSMTSVLSHIHFLLTNWKPVNYESLSEGFQGLPNDFSYANKLPAAIILRKIDDASTDSENKPVYAIDKDKSYDVEEDNVLLWVGTQLEKQLTMDPEEFSGLLRTNPMTSAVEKKMNEREAYHYSKANKILMRSQLDGFDTRLPRKTFDIKTRAVVAVRQDILNYKAGAGYNIKKSRGLFESFEREYYDMVRSSFLKYSLQARIGAMDGIFVAYHNTRRIFGFQYVPLEEMDERLHGSTLMATQSFKHSVGVLENALDEATSLIPNETLSITFETREGEQFMSVYVESAEDTRPDKATYVIDYEVESFLDNKKVPKDKHVDFTTVKGEDPTWTIRLTSRTSTLKQVENVKAKLSQSRESLVLMNSVVLPPGMSAKDLMKLREERRTWNSPMASADEGDRRLKDIEEEREGYIKEKFSQHGDPSSQNLTEDQSESLEQIKRDGERMVKEKLNEKPNERKDDGASVRQRKPSSLVRQLRKLSKAGLEEQSMMKSKFGEERVKRKLKFKPTDRPPPPKHANSTDAYKAALKDVVSVQGKPLPSPKLPQQTSLPLSRSRTHDDSNHLTVPDSTAKRSAKMSRSNTTNSKPDKKPGKHFDVIDSWDVTAVTGSALWHHDSPYDAASPSRNNHKKAPVKAFDAQMLAESQHVKPVETEEEKEVRIREDKKKRNPLLEVWGKHEEEPWEAFSAGAPNQPAGRSHMHSNYQESPLLPAKPQRKPSSRIPPPRPIQLGEEIDPDKPIQWSGGSRRRATVGTGDTINRSQSILQRWRSSRKSPKHGQNQSQSQSQNYSTNSSASHTPSISPSPSAYDKDLPKPPTAAASPSSPASKKTATPPPVSYTNSANSPKKDKENDGQPMITRKRSLMDKVRGLGKGVKTRSRDVTN